MAWRDEMYEEIKLFLNLPVNAEIIELEPNTEAQGQGGCDTCSSTAFVIDVWFKTPGKYSTSKRYEGDLSDFLAAVWDNSEDKRAAAFEAAAASD